MDTDVNDFSLTSDPTGKSIYMVTAVGDFRIPYDDLIKAFLRSNGSVPVGIGVTVINFSSSFPAGTNYSLQIYDADGIGVGLASKTDNGFTVESLGAGNIGYIAIINT